MNEWTGKGGEAAWGFGLCAKHVIWKKEAFLTFYCGHFNDWVKTLSFLTPSSSKWYFESTCSFNPQTLFKGPLWARCSSRG